MDVEYHEISGFPGYYVGSDGSVWSKKWLGHQQTEEAPWRQLVGCPDKDGYLRVRLCVNGRRFTYPIHRLVLEAFVGPRPQGMECRHGAGGILDNSLSNICWGTNIENAADKLRDGTKTWCAGETNGQAKLMDDEVLEIRRRVAAGESQASMAREFGVSHSLISLIVLCRLRTNLP